MFFKSIVSCHECGVRLEKKHAQQVLETTNGRYSDNKYTYFYCSAHRKPYDGINAGWTYYKRMSVDVYGHPHGYVQNEVHSRVCTAYAAVLMEKEQKETDGALSD